MMQNAFQPQPKNLCKNEKQFILPFTTYSRFLLLVFQPLLENPLKNSFKEERGFFQAFEKALERSEPSSANNRPNESW